MPTRPSPGPAPAARAARLLHRFTTAVTAVAVLLLGAPAFLGQSSGQYVGGPGGATDPDGIAGTTEAPGRGYDVRSSAGPLTLASHRKEHPNRKIKRYRVRRGDTPTEIAVRYHAWTDELIRMNHGSVLYAGEVIRIPVVVKAVKACDEHRHHRSNLHKHDKRGDKSGKKPAKKKQKKDKADPPKKHKAKKDKDNKKKRDRWKGEHATRAEVRRVIIRTANDIGVNPDLALAIAWMESGWQQKRVSSAGALGAMQVMPGTGQWMSVMVGRKLHLRHLDDNVIAGVTLIEWLRSEARLKVAVAGYYQGLAGVRRDGMYRSTKEYVANVLALKKRIARGWNPS